MIETRAQAEALHAAIETRDDAWNRFHNAALMPANQTPDERLVQTANNWVTAERAVHELSHGGDLVIPEPGVQAIAGTVPPTEVPASTEGKTKPATGKRRGRPPKTAAPSKPPEAAAGEAEGRTEEEVRADAAAAGSAPGPAEAGGSDFVAEGSNPQPGDAE